MASGRQLCISAVRKGPWKLHVRIGSQTGNNYGFRASREKPLLFQVEQDLGERIDRSKERPEIVEDLLGDLHDFEKQLQAEGTFWHELTGNQHGRKSACKVSE